MKSIGSSDRKAPAKPRIITLSRANRTLPVRRKIPSERMPPRLSPTTPAKKTPEANSAEFLMSIWELFLKNSGSQLRYTHKHQPYQKYVRVTRHIRRSTGPH